MTLDAGTRLGPYEILSPIGAGGMGEVYRATDTRLGREVAIKVLPTHLASTAQARQRFDREAKTISQLSHPHICALYDVGHQDGTDYLVMELLEGQTLADRLAKGPLPLDRALRCGIEIADALDKAHRQGIVHRDLKPANVMLTSSGVKLLDFGLAKALETGEPASILTALPTETPLTEKGTILGTVQYMTPEQLEGRQADARSDIYALGLVLYEMATGKAAFAGATRASLIGAILRDEPPPVSRAQALAPRTLDRVVSTCLAKEPEERWQTARDVALQLEGIRQERSGAEPAALPGPARRTRSALLPWAIAAAGVALAVFGLRSGLRTRSRAHVMRTFLPPPPKTTYHVLGANIGGVAVSPDGRRLAFGAREADGTHRLWVRDLDSLKPYALPGGEGGLFVFWSPDSRSIGFFAKGKLRAMEASPSPPPARDLADVVEPRGGSWGEDGTIVYSAQNFGGLMRVPAAGGTPSQATRLDAALGETSHRWPQFLPGGRRFLYEARRPDPKAVLEVAHTVFSGSLDNVERRQVLPPDAGASGAVYAPPGYLLFRRGNNVMAAAFDLKSLSIRGEPVILADNIQTFPATGASVFAVAGDLLVYSPKVEASLSRMAWLDRSGKETAPIGTVARIHDATLSPDGRSAVAARPEEPLPPDLWLFDTDAGRGIRLTRDTTAQVTPVFSQDGQRVFYSAYATGPWDLWSLSVQNPSDAKSLLQSPTTKTANAASPDGRYLLYREFNPGTRGDLKILSLTGDPKPRTFVATADEETNGTFSPDGRWVAYTSDETGRREIFVASFPDPVRRFRASSEGGSQPRWSRDGKELFYVQASQLMAAPVERRGEDLAFGESRALFSFPLFQINDPGFDMITRYDVAPDGRFFALLRAGDDVPVPLVVVSDWAETLKKP